MKDFKIILLKKNPVLGEYRFVANTKRAQLRISVIDGVPAESCTISLNAENFYERLKSEGFSFEGSL